MPSGSSIMKLAGPIVLWRLLTSSHSVHLSCRDLNQPSGVHRKDRAWRTCGCPYDIESEEILVYDYVLDERGVAKRRNAADRITCRSPDGSASTHNLCSHEIRHDLLVHPVGPLATPDRLVCVRRQMTTRLCYL